MLSFDRGFVRSQVSIPMAAASASGSSIKREGLFEDSAASKSGSPSGGGEHSSSGRSEKKKKKKDKKEKKEKRDKVSGENEVC